MHKKKYLFLIIFLFLFNISNIKAETCDAEDMIKVKELVKSIPANYEYVGNLELAYDLQAYEVWFDFGELDGKIYISEANNRNSQKIYHSNERLKVNSGLVKFNVYYDTCAEEKIGTISIDLKKFNEYSIRTECVNLQEEEICDAWYQGTIDENYFSEIVDNYLEENNNNSIINFILNYYLYIIGGIIILILIIILLSIRHRRRNRLD